MNITIVSSSPRKISLSYRIALYLEGRLKSGTSHRIQFIDVRDWLPKFVEDQPVFKSIEDCPEELKPLGEIMYGTDAFIMVSPEYNGGYPYSLKRLFDHFDKQAHKVFAIAASSDGALGGMRAALALQHFAVALFGILSPHMLITPHVDRKFDDEGKLLDEKFQKKIDIFVKEFLWLAEKIKE